MKRETKYKNNSDGTITKIETIETTPEDGFVNKKRIRPSMFDRGEVRYVKGHSKTVIYSKEATKSTYLILLGIYALIFIIGLIITLFGLWIFGIPLMFVSLYTFIKTRDSFNKR